MSEWSWIDGTCASRYDDTPAARQTVRERYSHIADHATGETVLDLGCAYGIGTATLAEEGYDATGVEIEEEIVAQAREEFPEVVFVIGDIRDLWLGGVWDTYVVSDVLQHIPESRALLEWWETDLSSTLVGTTLERGHPNIPKERLPRHPGLLTPAEIRAVFDDAETWRRDTDAPQRFWFRVDR